MMAAQCEWGKSILDQLEQKKYLETTPFKELINSHEKLLLSSNVYKLRNSKLELQALQLRQEILEIQSQPRGINSQPTGDKSLEEKVYRLQEELTELHRTKGEHAQHIIDLTMELKSKDKIISEKEVNILECQSNNEAMSAETNNLHAAIMELESSNQVLKDEYQALQILNSSNEEKLRKIHLDNQELIQRWMQQKAEVADQLNMQNEFMAFKRQQKMQQELFEAAKEQIHVPKSSRKENGCMTNVTTLPSSFICITSVPDRPIQSEECHEGEILSARFSYSGKYFVTGGSDRKVKMWEIEGRGSFREKATLSGCQQSVTCARFDMSEKLILAASNDSACRIWSSIDLRLKHTLTGHTNKVLTAKFLGTDTSKIVSGSYDRTLKLWDLRSKVCTKTIFAGSSCNDLVTSDIAGTTVISGHFDKKIRFWDVRCEQNINEIQLQGKVTSLDLSPDMNYLLASSRDDTLKIIDLRRNQIVSTYRSDGFKVAFDYSRACFSPDSQYVACGSYDYGVYVWNTRTNLLDKILKEHKSAIVATAWHPNGTCLVSCDKNKRIVLWTDI